ncbi:MAG: polysaccharide deacetylase family protein [Clostridia bacterium]|nr:polysaccharide deacetylase family protein [Clostridia bacterium]
MVITMDKYLIINADDFGMCRAHNIATMELFKCRSITSATIMAPCKYAGEAVEFAVRNPQLAIGVHLTVTSEWQNYRWGAISENAVSLTDSEGCFFRTCTEFAGNARISDLEAELIAQIELLRSEGLVPSHLDNHMGALYGIYNGDFSFLELVIDIAARYGLPFRFPSRLSANTFSNGTLNISISEQAVRAVFDRFSQLTANKGVATPDYLLPGDWKGEQDKSFENYREYIFELYRTLENGVTETYIHPAIECDEIKSITPCWHRRVWEHRLFSDPNTLEYIRSLGIKLINYRDLEEIKLSAK